MEFRPGGEFRIRPYVQSDLEQLRWLFARTPPWGRTCVEAQPLPDDLEDVTANYPGGAFVALENDVAAGKVVGEALVGFTAAAILGAEGLAEIPPFFDTGKIIAQIHWVSVAPERWRGGIGRALTEHCILWCREAGADLCILETTIWQEGAVALYESMGFTEAGRTSFGEWKQVWLQLPLR